MTSFIRTCALVAAVCAAPAAMAVPYIDMGYGHGSGRMGWGNIGVWAEGTQKTTHITFGLYVYGADTPPSETFVDLVGMVGVHTGDTWPIPAVFSSVRLMSADGLTTYDSVSLEQGVPQLSFSFARVAAGQQYSLAFDGYANAAPADDPDFFFPIREWGYSVTATMSPAPEASSLLMAAVGLAGVVAWSRRKQAKAACAV